LVITLHKKHQIGSLFSNNEFTRLFVGFAFSTLRRKASVWAFLLVGKKGSIFSLVFSFNCIPKWRRLGYFEKTRNRISKSTKTSKTTAFSSLSATFPDESRRIPLKLQNLNQKSNPKQTAPILQFQLFFF
jgi:hypothetical protein